MLRFLQKKQVELLILGKKRLREADGIPFQYFPAVELVPQNAEVKAGRAADGLPQPVCLAVDPGGQKAVFTGVEAAVLPRDDHAEGCGNKVCTGLLCCFHQMRGKAGQQPVVAVRKLHVRSPGKCKPLIAGVRHTGVGLVHDPDAGVCGSKLPAKRQCAITGAIIQQDDLQTGAGLAADAVDAPAEGALCIVGRYDHADERRFHKRSLLCSVVLLL